VADEDGTGPGSYEVSKSERGGRSAWGRDARFRSAADEDGAGPGSYDVSAHKSIAHDGRGGGSSAFKSRSSRSLDLRDDAPGPGAYDVTKGERGSGSAWGRDARFRNAAEDGTGPGSYDVSKSERRSGSAWGRDARFRSAADEDGAGPGSYDVSAHKSIAHDGRSGGSSAFKSRSSRSPDLRSRDAPGPGTYNVDAQPRTTTPRKAISSFGFKRPEVKQHVDDVPGPGHYDTTQGTRRSISSPFKSRTVQRPSRAVEQGPSPSTYDPHPQSSLIRGTSAAFKSGGARFAAPAKESSALMYDTRWYRSVTDDRGFCLA
jgi:hypothetical protein